MCAGDCDPNSGEFVPVNENVAQVIVQTELEQLVAGVGDRSSVFLVVFYDQAVCFCAVTEFPVVICTTTGAVMNAGDVVEIMNHLMEQRGANVLDGTGYPQCRSSVHPPANDRTDGGFVHS